ncbi:signal peptidase II [soil metagenome]
MRTRTAGFLIGAAAFALIADVATKAWAEAALVRHAPAPVLGDAFWLTLGYNPGVAFGFFPAGGHWVLLLTGVAILALGAWLIHHLRTDEARPWAAVPVGLLLGGALANFVDRLGDGVVTDFLDLGLGTARWPTFNLADTFITLGVLYLLFLTQRSDRSAEAHS